MMASLRRRTDRARRPRIDTSAFAFPKPGDKARAMAIESETFNVKREVSAEFRRAVFARDAGVCALCGLDTEALASQWIADVAADLAQYDCNICGNVTTSVPCVHCSAPSCGVSFQHRNEFRAMLEGLGFPKELSRKYNGVTLWHADHKVPVHEGGVDLGVENGRTLCLPCHAKVTAYQAETRALRRRHAR